MTEPTDKELEAFAIEEQFLLFCDVDEFTQIARAVLAKYGTPPVVAGEPIGYLYCGGSYGDELADWEIVADQHQCDKLNEHHGSLGKEAKLPIYAAPHPTQAQAGAVPLTCEWAHNENDGFWESACGEAWRFDDGGPAENSMHFCHSCGKSLRIKGKEAGNADA